MSPSQWARKGFVLELVPSRISQSLRMRTVKLGLAHGMRAVEKTSSHVHWCLLMNNRECPIGWQILPIKGTTKAIGVLQPSLRCCCVSIFWEFRRLQLSLIDDLPGDFLPSLRRARTITTTLLSTNVYPNAASLF